MTQSKPETISIQQFNTCVLPQAQLLNQTNQEPPSENRQTNEISKIKNGLIIQNNKDENHSLSFSFERTGLFIKHRNDDGAESYTKARWFQATPDKDSNLNIRYYNDETDHYVEINPSKDSLLFVKPQSDKINADFAFNVYDNREFKLMQSDEQLILTDEKSSYIPVKSENYTFQEIFRTPPLTSHEKLDAPFMTPES